MLKKRLIFLLISILILFGLVGISGLLPVTHTQGDTEELVPVVNAAYVETTPIIQTPELPTGCESVALTMALNACGYQLEKTTIAKDWLIYNNENYVIGYSGDPFSTNGAGIFAPGLCDTANKFLKENDSSLKAYNVTGMDMEDLYGYLAMNIPVVVWITSDYNEPAYTESVIEYEGVRYPWFRNEHCVMLGGFNREEAIITVYDPLQGKIDVDMSKFEEIYNKIGKYAMMIH